LPDSARAIQGRLLIIEDHYAHGGPGDAVLSVIEPEGIKVHKLAVRTIPHSGKPDELTDPSDRTSDAKECFRK
jgi:transketolase